MKGLKNYNLRFDRIKIWNIHIKTKCVPSVIGDSRWPKYHPNITQILPGHAVNSLPSCWTSVSPYVKMSSAIILK